jgi:hypothetical protein
VATGVRGTTQSSQGYGGRFENLADGVGLYARSGDPSVADIVVGGTGSGGTLDDGVITSDPQYPSSDLFLAANDGVVVQLDNDGDAEDADFEIVVAGNRIFDVDESGEVYADGTFHSGGADFAEMLPGPAELQPGDVLVVDHDSELARSTAPLQTSVVGVYSTQPGVGGAAHEDDRRGKVPLAIVGIVPVKVSAENGPIRPGDLLVSAATAGHAMRAPRPAPAGTVIGKSLQSLSEATGMVRVLVTLQ